MKRLKIGQKKKHQKIKTSEHYNEIYSNILDDDNDVIGRVAYSIYKKDKLVWIEEEKIKQNKTIITNEDLKPFHNFANRPTEILKYKKEAKEIIDVSLNNMMIIWLRDTSKKFKNNRVKEITNGVIRTLIILLIVNILTFFLLIYKFNFEEVIAIYRNKAKVIIIDTPIIKNDSLK
ncbi:MAG: hypothetical protein WCK02_12290 [Bacteroidota bacterium]